MAAKKESKPFFIVNLTLADIMILMVLAFGTMSTFNSNRENLDLALLFLFAASAMYLIASTYARRAGGGRAKGFTRALNAFVSGLVFLVAPCIFFYHWQYNSNFASGVMLVFILSGILRIAAFDDIGSRGDAAKFYYTGMPVFWSPVIVAVFYLFSFGMGADIINGMLSLTLIIFSFLMLVNRDFKYLHKPIAWSKVKKKK
ncbi:MAG TPA: hypothetical protein ENN55_02630 [Firmicutes bacterium]|nr:hypothetical protein [Bacillota bacterium]